MENGDENGGEGDIEEDEKEGGAASIEEQPVEIAGGLKGSMSSSLLLAESQCLVPLKEVGIMDPSKRQISQVVP